MVIVHLCVYIYIYPHTHTNTHTHTHTHTYICIFFREMSTCMLCVCVCLIAQSCLTLCNPMDCSLPGFSVHGDSPGKNTEVGGLPCPPPMDFLNQGLNQGLPHCRWILYHLRHQGSPYVSFAHVLIGSCFCC